MKAILEFNLNEAEDVMAHKRCVKATDMAIALFELTQQLPEKLKHLEELAEGGEINLVNFVIEEINFTLETNGIMLGELIN
jgi:hypothetical protein